MAHIACGGCFQEGDVHKCDNYRPISLLAVGYKPFACNLLRPDGKMQDLNHVFGSRKRASD